MTYSIYHIENDIDCKVLKFGKELCVATAGEDTVVELSKGRHKLTFVSLENHSDSYSIIFEVNENGIEDFIEVSLSPIRNLRIEREQVEQESIRIQEENRRELELQRLENERLEALRVAKEEQKAYEAEHARLSELKAKEERDSYREKVRNKVKSALAMYAELEDIETYNHNGVKWAKEEDKGFYLTKNGIRTSDTFDQVSRFSNGMARVRKNGKFGFVNEQGNLQIACIYKIAGHFYDGYSLVFNGYTHALIDLNGNIILDYLDHSYPQVFGMRAGTPILYGLYSLVDHIDNSNLNIIVINLVTREEVYSVYLRYHIVVAKKICHVYYPIEDLDENICEEFKYYEPVVSEIFRRPNVRNFRPDGILRLGGYGFINTYGCLVCTNMMSSFSYDFVDSKTHIYDRGKRIDEEGNLINYTEF